LRDTNHLADAIRSVSTLRERLDREHRNGNRLGTIVPVLCELEVGIQQTADPDAYRRRLRRLSRFVRVWPIEPPLAPLFAEIVLQLKRQGRALSFTDIMLAAMIRQKKPILLTSDRDFEALPDIRTENWLI